jgi:hypothetical protein
VRSRARPTDKSIRGDFPASSDHLYYKELTALAAAGHFSEEECQELRDHLASCTEVRKSERAFGDLVRCLWPLRSSIHEAVASAFSSWPSAKEFSLLSIGNKMTSPRFQVSDRGFRSVLRCESVCVASLLSHRLTTWGYFRRRLSVFSGISKVMWHDLAVSRAESQAQKSFPCQERTLRVRVFP